jgi:hypothetical protein
MLAVNIVERPYSGLIEPLSYNQGAPLGFLFIQKMAVNFFGNYDYILRLFPFIAGTLSLLLIYKTANAFVEKTATFVTITLFAVNPKLIYYTSECKQYSTDVLVSLLLLLCASRCVKPDAGRKDLTLLGVVGVFSIWLSHPALFTLSGIGLALLLRLFTEGWRESRATCVVFCTWGLSFTILYLVSLRHLADNSVLIDYWREGFMPLLPWQDIAWFPRTFVAMMNDPVGMPSVPLAIIAFLLGIIGAVSLFARRWTLAVMLVAPFPIVLLASGLKRYPFSDRLLLFTLPFLFLLIAEGAERIRKVFFSFNKAVSAAVLLALGVTLLYEPARTAYGNLLEPELREDVTPAMRYLSRYKLASDTIYVYYGCVPAFRFYASQYGITSNRIVFGNKNREQPFNYIREIDTLRDSGRVWLLFSHIYSNPMVGNEERYLLEYLLQTGITLDHVVYKGAHLWLVYLGIPTDGLSRGHRETQYKGK